MNKSFNCSDRMCGATDCETCYPGCNNHKPEGKEEGNTCNRDGCTGEMEYKKDGVCSCHINPPCSACVDSILTCNECGFEIPNN